MQINFFEEFDDTNVFRLAFIKNIYELRCGILTLKEKLETFFANRKFSNTKIFVNSRLLLNNEIKQLLAKNSPPIILSKNNKLLLAVLENNSNFDKNKLLSNSSKIELKENCLIDYPWDLIFLNAQEIENDLSQLLKIKKFKKIKKNLYLGKNIKIEQGVFFNTENGPIVIDNNSIIMANSVIVGPVYIGNGTIVKALSKIYGGTSIGPYCKVGGEIEASIFQGFSNKQHEGFLGHSFVGEWVNIGAGTNNSDLKNNYSTVKMVVNKKEFETNLLFMGAIIGDHSKLGINTMINTGTFIGISSNVFGSGYTPKYIPPFTWGGIGKSEKYKLEKSIETAKTIMLRRKIRMSKEYEELFRKAFDIS